MASAALPSASAAVHLIGKRQAGDNKNIRRTHFNGLSERFPDVHASPPILPAVYRTAQEPRPRPPIRRSAAIVSLCIRRPLSTPQKQKANARPRPPARRSHRGLPGKKQCHAAAAHPARRILACASAASSSAAIVVPRIQRINALGLMRLLLRECKVGPGGEKLSTEMRLHCWWMITVSSSDSHPRRTGLLPSRLPLARGVAHRCISAYPARHKTVSPSAAVTTKCAVRISPACRGVSSSTASRT